jgi:competence CoiA-like predicted nuclease
MKNQRTINEVLDTETGQEIIAHDFFQQPEFTIFKHRRYIEDSYTIGLPPRFICYFCRQRVKINGGVRRDNVNQIYHFAHYRDSDECPIKTATKYTEEEIRCVKYNGAKESQIHIDTKEAIGEYLRQNESHNLGVSEVIVDKVLKTEPISKRWRKPDVRCKYKGTRLVFEIQLSTTFLSVIADRERYYKENGIFIIWIFKEFSIESELQRFAQKDIFYGNNCNVYVLDEESINLSKTFGDLYLKCYYLEHYNNDGKIEKKWQAKSITLKDLTFDNIDNNVCFFNSDAQKLEIEREIEANKQKEAAKGNAKRLRDERKQSTKQIEERKYIQQKNELWNEIYDQESNFLYLLQKGLSYNYEEIYDYFKSNDTLTENERTYIRTAFERGAGNFDNLPLKEFAERIAAAVFIKKGIDKNLPPLPYRVMTVMYALLSLKKRKIIGFTNNLHLMIAHKIIDSRKDYAELFLRAMDHYNMRDYIMQQDESKKLQTKLAKFEISEIRQTTSNNSWIKINFPELF